MRLDQFLVQFKNIESRTKAQDLILSKNIIVNGKVIEKSSFDVTESDKIEINNNDLLKYVSRAGLKLESALMQLSLNVENKIVLDIGQSTGGFTDCCLQQGAQKVVGFDVGEQQLHEKVKSNPKVTFFEKLNVKNLLSNQNFLKAVPNDGFDLIVCDVSFISLTQVVSHVVQFLKPNGEYLFLVKPQFECGQKYLDKNGIVKNKNVYIKIESDMKELFQKNFGNVIGYFESGLSGKDGNLEFFIYGRSV